MLADVIPTDIKDAKKNHIDEICSKYRPLIGHQKTVETGARCVQVCRACLLPVGTLASQCLDQNLGGNPMGNDLYKLGPRK